MATTTMPAIGKHVKGGSFLIEEGTTQDIFTPEDFTQEHRQTAKTAHDFAINEVMAAADQIEAKDFSVVTAGPLITLNIVKEAENINDWGG